MRQFSVSKTVDVKKSHVGLTFIRDRTIRHKSFTERAPKLGGLVEFYRSPDRVMWTPTGINVPDYPKLAQLWWQQHRRRELRRVHAATGDGPAGQGDGPGDGAHAGSRQEGQGLWRLRTAAQRRRRIREEWLGKPNGPKAKLENEKPKGETIDYDELVKRWRQALGSRSTRRRFPSHLKAAGAFVHVPRPGRHACDKWMAEAKSVEPRPPPMTLEFKKVIKRVGARRISMRRASILPRRRSTSSSARRSPARRP